MTTPPSDRLTKALVGLLVLTGILRIWVIVDTFQLAERHNGHVCTTSYANPTRVRCIDTDEVPEVIDHRKPSPMAPEPPN